MNEDNEKQDVASLDEQPSLEDQAAAYYWLTIREFVSYVEQFGLEKVVRDVQQVAYHLAKERQKEHPIIVPGNETIV